MKQTFCNKTYFPMFTRWPIFEAMQQFNFHCTWFWNINQSRFPLKNIILNWHDEIRKKRPWAIFFKNGTNFWNGPNFRKAPFFRKNKQTRQCCQLLSWGDLDLIKRDYNGWNDSLFIMLQRTEQQNLKRNIIVTHAVKKRIERVVTLAPGGSALRWVSFCTMLLVCTHNIYE